jgi:hypothetical protein
VRLTRDVADYGCREESFCEEDGGRDEVEAAFVVGQERRRVAREVLKQGLSLLVAASNGNRSIFVVEFGDRVG